MRALIFAAGLLNDPTSYKRYHRANDIVIAADGGARHCQSLGIKPDIILGDFDSLTHEELAHFEKQDVQIVRFPARKDFTDLELALQHAHGLGAEEIIIYGALGLRWDQTLANLVILANPAWANAHIKIVDGDQEIFLVRGLVASPIIGYPGDTVSLIPIGSDAQGIVTVGLEYPLNNETLYLGTSRGVSNVLLASQASVALQHGLLICVVIHHTFASIMEVK